MAYRILVFNLLIFVGGFLIALIYKWYALKIIGRFFHFVNMEIYMFLSIGLGVQLLVNIVLANEALLEQKKVKAKAYILSSILILLIGCAHCGGVRIF